MLNGLLQLPNVAGPRIGEKVRERVGRQRPRRPGVLTAEVLQEVAGQQRDVVATMRSGGIWIVMTLRR